MGIRHGSRELVVEARPQPLTIRPRDTAVIVVDMQNDFGAEGGMFARAGIDMAAIQATVAPTARVLAVARRSGMLVVYLTMAFAPDLSDAGGGQAPNRVRHLAFGVGEPVTAPDGRPSRILIQNTWNTDIVADLAPEPGDHVVVKHRYSGFFDTNLDGMLKGLGITTLVFTGCTTSVCVESTRRDAFFRDYRCLLRADCTAEPSGHDLPRSNYAATLLLIELMYGWVSDSATVVRALTARPAMTQR